MRVLAMAVFALLAAADQSASAASCSKGMLWPYVRNPGDCLTDTEIAAGARGVYNGPVNTNPDVGAMQSIPAPAPVQQPVQQPVTINTNGAPAPAAVPAQAVAPAPAFASTPAPVATYAAPAAPANCTKGYLWPFVKKPGDCASGTTAQERTKVRGPVCYYRKPGDCQSAEPNRTASVVTSYGGVGPVAQAQAMAAAAPVATVPANPGATATAVAIPAAAVVPSCTKGPLWPFVKKPGDCPSTAEQKRTR